MQGVEAAVDIDAHDAVEIGGIDLVALEVGLAGDAGAIDQNVDAPRLRGGFIDGPTHRGVVGDVDAGRDGAGSQGGAGFVQRLLVEVENDQANAAAGETLGHGEAETVGSATDHGGLIFPIGLCCG